MAKNTRREFLSGLSSAVALGVLGMSTRAPVVSALDMYPRSGDPLLKELSAIALTAARTAGARYADVRFSHTRLEDIECGVAPSWRIWENYEHGAVGVRTLVDGAWGFAGSNAWTADEVARLARESVAQARVNAQASRNKFDLESAMPAASGDWKMPVRKDPFDVRLSEKLDVMWAFTDAVSRIDAPVEVIASYRLRHVRQEKTFGSTDGAYATQTLYTSHPFFTVGALDGRKVAGRTLDRLQPAAAGWEHVTEASHLEHIPELVEEVLMMLDAEPVDPDRYDIVCDGYTTARLAGLTIGVAAELDRVLGYEANAGGTSYLAPAEETLGKLRLGPPELNVTADRRRPGGLATTKWDDEGVVPDEYDVIRNGVLVNYHSSRGIGTTSRGCAVAETALGIPQIGTPNISLQPGKDDLTFADLVSTLEKGLVVIGGAATPDWFGPVTADRQQLNGEINPSMVYEVRNGKRTRFIRNVEVLFRSPELWNGLQHLGGKSSQVYTGMTVRKGQPGQWQRFGIGGVAARFANVPVTDRARGA